jgi:hypothetical protein
MIGRNTYEKLIPRHEREALEQALGMEGGYVLDFSDRTFNDFFYERPLRSIRKISRSSLAGEEHRKRKDCVRLSNVLSPR